MSVSTQKNWWESSAFFIGLATLLGSAWGLSEDSATSVVTAVTGLIAAGAAVWHYFKSSKFRGFSDWISDGNTWVYLTATVGAFIPNSAELFPSLEGLAKALLSKDFGAIISAAVAAAVMFYNIFLKKK